MNFHMDVSPIAACNHSRSDAPDSEDHTGRSIEEPEQKQQPAARFDNDRDDESDLRHWRAFLSHHGH